MLQKRKNSASEVSWVVDWEGEGVGEPGDTPFDTPFDPMRSEYRIWNLKICLMSLRWRTSFFPSTNFSRATRTYTERHILASTKQTMLKQSKQPQKAATGKKISPRKSDKLMKSLKTDPGLHSK